MIDHNQQAEMKQLQQAIAERHDGIAMGVESDRCPSELTDEQLANRLHATITKVGSDSYTAGDLDELVELENEVLGRLDVDLAETEQGLTEKAETAIDEYIDEHATDRPTRTVD